MSSGEDLASKGRELEHHFRVHGTPIMIGEFAVVMVLTNAA